MSSRTFSSAAIGHIAASVGTVETTRDRLADEPRGEILARPHEGPWRRHEARTVTPGEPHLLAGGVEGHGQSREHPVAGTEGRILEEYARFGIHERGGRAVAHRDALRHSGRARREDDPRVIVDRRRRDHDQCVRAGMRRRAIEERSGCGIRFRLIARDVLAVAGDHAAHLRLAEDQARPLVGVVGVHRDVGRAGREHAQDREVQLLRPGYHAHADPVAAADAGGVQAGRRGAHAGHELAIAQRAGPVVERGRLGMPCRGLPEDVDERARPRRLCRTVEHALRAVRAGHVRRAGRSAAPW